MTSLRFMVVAKAFEIVYIILFRVTEALLRCCNGLLGCCYGLLWVTMTLLCVAMALLWVARALQGVRLFCRVFICSRYVHVQVNKAFLGRC